MKNWIFSKDKLLIYVRILFPWPNWIPTPVAIINKTIQEDRFDIPEVPMEEDWYLDWQRPDLYEVLKDNPIEKVL